MVCKKGEPRSEFPLFLLFSFQLMFPFSVRKHIILVPREA